MLKPHTTTLDLLNTFNQIADFGMARDVSDDTYYMSSGGKIPLKWTAPEVSTLILSQYLYVQVYVNRGTNS